MKRLSRSKISIHTWREGEARPAGGVGVLVDEATVEIENIHTHMAGGLSRARAVLDACRKTALPRLLSMLCVLAVFLPSFFLVGVGKQLFVPLSLAVGCAMSS